MAHIEITHNNESNRDKAVSYIIFGVAALLCLAALAPIADREWFWDDTGHILNNPAVRGDDISLVFTTDFWGRTRNSPEDGVWSYRPLATLLSRAAWQISPTPTMARSLNLLLHILTALLLFRMAGRILPPIGAAAAAALFMLHPTHGEVVSFAVGRADILALLLMGLCFNFYLKEKKGTALFIFFIAMLAKESAMLIAVPIGVHALTSGRWRSRAQILGGASPYFIIVIFNYLLHFWVTGLLKQPAGELTNPLTTADGIHTLLHMAAFPGWYLGRLLWPLNYPADFSAGSFIVRSVNDPILWAGIAGTAAAALPAIIIWKRKAEWRSCAIGLGLFFALGAMAFQWFGKGSFVMADRLIYASSAGLAIAAGFFASKLGNLLGKIKPDSTFLRSIPTIVLCAALSAALFNSIPAFGGHLQLAESYLENSPGGARAYFMLGNALSEKGQFAPALEAYIKADRIHPDYAPHLMGTAKALSELGREKEAGDIFERLYTINRNGAEDIGFSYATHLWRSGRLEEARKTYADVAEKHPYSFRTALELGRITSTLGRHTEALKLIEKACRLPTAAIERCRMEHMKETVLYVQRLIAEGAYEEARTELEATRIFRLPEGIENELKALITRGEEQKRSQE